MTNGITAASTASLEAAIAQSVATNSVNNVKPNSGNTSAATVNPVNNVVNSTNNSGSTSAFRVSKSGEDPFAPQNASNNYVTQSGNVNPSATSVVNSGNPISPVITNSPFSAVDHVVSTDDIITYGSHSVQSSSSVASSASSHVVTPSSAPAPSSHAYVPTPTPDPTPSSQSVTNRMMTDDGYGFSVASSSSAPSSVASSQSSSSSDSYTGKNYTSKNPKVYLQATAFVKTKSGKRQILTEPIKIDSKGHRSFVYSKTITKNGKTYTSHMMPVSRKSYNAMMKAGHKPSGEIHSDADFDKKMKELQAKTGVSTKSKAGVVLGDTKYKTTFRAKVSSAGNGTLIPDSKGHFQKVAKSEQVTLTDANKAVAKRLIGDKVNLQSGHVTDRPKAAKGKTNKKAKGKAAGKSSAAHKSTKAAKLSKAAKKAHVATQASSSSSSASMKRQSGPTR